MRLLCRIFLRHALMLILFVADLFHPVDNLAVELFLNSDVRHGRDRRSPMLLARMRTAIYIARAAGSESKARDVERSRSASICAFRSATFCSARAMASAPA
jgi:hypothetical protein